MSALLAEFCAEEIHGLSTDNAIPLTMVEVRGHRERIKALRMNLDRC